MRGGRILLIGGIVLVVGALAVGAVLLLRGGGGEEPPPDVVEGTPQPTPLPEDLARIIVSAQDIPRGTLITSDLNAVVTQNWPKDSVPPGAIYELENVYDKTTRVEIPLGMPILESMLTLAAGELGAEGSDVALQIPEGMGAYAMPVGRYSSVAWALQPGDHVDVIISLLMAELDEEFQTLLPNQMACVSPPAGEECQSGVMGRLEVLPNAFLVNLTPSEGQRPRLVTQLTVQNVMVLQVGDWPEPGEEEMGAVEGEELPAEEGGQPTPEEGEAVAEQTRPDIQPVTLAVTPQEALVLDYVQAVGARVNFVLRSAADAQNGSRFSTEPVTLDYIMSAYRIELPTKLPYGVVPSISQLERIARSENAAQYGGAISGGGTTGE